MSRVDLCCVLVLILSRVGLCCVLNPRIIKGCSVVCVSKFLILLGIGLC